MPDSLSLQLSKGDVIQFKTVKLVIPSDWSGYDCSLVLTHLEMVAEATPAEQQ